MSLGVRHKRDINTPLIAGREPDGELYLSVASPMQDLWRDPSRGEHISSEFSHFLDRVVFADAYTQGGKCCVVDVFAGEAAVRSGGESLLDDHLGGSIVKVRWKIEAVWGGAGFSGRKTMGEDRRQKLIDVPLARLVHQHAEPLGHWRMTLNPGRELPRYTSQVGWVRRASLHIKDTVELIYSQRGAEGTYEDSSSNLSYLQYLGTQPFLSVADYFVNRGWGG